MAASGDGGRSVVPAGGLPRARRSATVVVAALVVLSVTLVFGTLSHAVLLARSYPSIAGGGIVPKEAACLAASGMNLLLDALAMCAFLPFATTVAGGGECFSRRQTVRLVALGACNGLAAAVDWVASWAIPVGKEGDMVCAAFLEPEYDLNSLMLSMLFFALAGVFEYGRILQKDSESIL